MYRTRSGGRYSGSRLHHSILTHYRHGSGRSPSVSRVGHVIRRSHGSWDYRKEPLSFTSTALSGSSALVTGSDFLEYFRRRAQQPRTTLRTSSFERIIDPKILFGKKV